MQIVGTPKSQSIRKAKAEKGSSLFIISLLKSSYTIIKMAQWVKIPGTKPDYLSLNPRTNMVVGEK